MAYNKRNFLEKVIQVQELYQQHKKEDTTHVGVYRHHIKPTFKISLRTLYAYLEIPAKAQLKELLK